MPQFVVAVGVSMILAILSGGIWLAQTTLTTVAGIQSSLATAESAVPWAQAQAANTIAAAIQNSPTAALTQSIFPQSGWTYKGTTVVATLEGDSRGSASGSLLCANLELNPSINERCVAIDLTLTTGYPQVTVSERDVARVFNVSPYVRFIGSYRLGSMSDRMTSAAADTGGCAGAGTGCDPNQVQSADSQTLSAGLNCTLGSNSGSCPSGNVFDKSSYGNVNWTNGQTSQDTSQ